MAPPYPGAFTEVGGRRFVVARARRPHAGMPAALSQPASAALPGLHVIDGQIVGVCGDGGVILVRELLDDSAAAAPVPAGALSVFLTALSKEENR